MRYCFRGKQNKTKEHIINIRHRGTEGNESAWPWFLEGSLMGRQGTLEGIYKTSLDKVLSLRMYELSIVNRLNLFTALLEGWRSHGEDF